MSISSDFQKEKPNKPEATFEETITGIFWNWRKTGGDGGWLGEGRQCWGQKWHCSWEPPGSPLRSWRSLQPSPQNDLHLDSPPNLVSVSSPCITENGEVLPLGQGGREGWALRTGADFSLVMFSHTPSLPGAGWRPPRAGAFCGAMKGS